MLRRGFESGAALGDNSLLVETRVMVARPRAIHEIESMQMLYHHFLSRFGGTVIVFQFEISDRKIPPLRYYYREFR